MGLPHVGPEKKKKKKKKNILTSVQIVNHFNCISSKATKEKDGLCIRASSYFFGNIKVHKNKKCF
jgi:hypothetical protein